MTDRGEELERVVELRDYVNRSDINDFIKVDLLDWLDLRINRISEYIDSKNHFEDKRPLVVFHQEIPAAHNCLIYYNEDNEWANIKAEHLKGGDIFRIGQKAVVIFEAVEDYNEQKQFISCRLVSDLDLLNKEVKS